MADAQMMHARKMAEGQEAYQGKLLEARQSDWKDEAVLIILSLPVLVLAWAVVSDDPTAMDKVKLFFEMFSELQNGLQIYGSLSWRVSMVLREHKSSEEEKNK